VHVCLHHDWEPGAIVDQDRQPAAVLDLVDAGRVAPLCPTSVALPCGASLAATLRDAACVERRAAARIWRHLLRMVSPGRWYSREGGGSPPVQVKVAAGLLRLVPMGGRGRGSGSRRCTAWWTKHGGGGVSACVDNGKRRMGIIIILTVINWWIRRWRGWRRFDRTERCRFGSGHRICYSVAGYNIHILSLYINTYGSTNLHPRCRILFYTQQ
jgi:hypothetical protein